MKRSGVRLVAASPAHIGTIARRMRDADREECAAAGRTPKEALRRALRSSLWSLTAVVDGRPEAMLGISPVCIMGDKGNPWFLGTDRVFEHGRAMIEWAPAVLDRMHGDFHRLENVVSLGNRRAIRLLRAWGFTVEDEPFEYGGIKFVRFWRLGNV